MPEREGEREPEPERERERDLCVKCAFVWMLSGCDPDIVYCVKLRAGARGRPG